ncbi:MAG: DUF1684 domain-containing protein [Sandaracinaceae bacterium]|nr:DUF1684 domain-containing protein [Sandaracinaceae bacterium]
MRLGPPLLTLASFRLAGVVASVAIGGCGASATASATTTAAAHAEDAPEAWRTFRDARHDSLAGDEGWLTLVALGWLDAPRTRVGSAPESELVLPADHCPPHLGTVEVRDGTAYFTADPSASVTAGDAPVTTEIALVPDDPGPATVLASGPLRLHVIARAGRLGLRVKDRESPARLGFTGPAFFDYDARFRVSARFEPAAEGQELPIVNVLGQAVNEALAGRLRFTWEGREHVLLATWAGASPSEGLSLMIRDATSDEGTSYGAGRYLELDAPAPDGSATIDFNFAYTPPCGYTDFATCPLPPSDNELDFAITAGERAPEGH